MFVTNWISTTKIQKISEITNFFRHYFLSRTEVINGLDLKRRKYGYYYGYGKYGKFYGYGKRYGYGYGYGEHFHDKES